MHRQLATRLASLAMAFVVTCGLAGGIHGLAAGEAAIAAAQLAHGATSPICARV